MKLQWCNPKSWQSTQPLNDSSWSGHSVSLQSMTAINQQQMPFVDTNCIRPRECVNNSLKGYSISQKKFQVKIAYDLI